MASDRGRHGRALVPTGWLVACAVAVCMSAARAEDCSVSCVKGLIHVLAPEGGPSDREVESAFTEEAPYSLLDIKRVAGTFGVELEGRECGLGEVFAHGAPVVLALRNPDHFLVVLNQDAKSRQVVDGSRLAVLDDASLRARFRGTALFVMQPNRDGPRVAVERAHHDAGVRGLGEDFVQTFQLTNAGTAPLSLRLESSFCCGTTATLDVDQVEPGGDAHLVLRARVKTLGPSLTAARVLTDDPNRPVVLLTTKAATPPGLTVRPERVSLADGRARTDLIVSPSPTARPGAYDAELIVKTTFRDAPTMKVPVKFFVRADTIARPAHIFHGFVSPGSGLPTKRLAVSTRSGTPFRVLRADTSDPRITVEQVGDATFDVSVDTSELGVLKGEVILTTDIPLEETIRVPVHVHVME